MPNGTQPIETARLHMRRFTLNDAEAMYNGWATDPEVTRYMNWHPHKDIAETKSTLAGWVADYESPGTYHWALALKDGTLIGSLGLLPAQHSESGRDAGYCIARPHWNRGYTTEALAAALDYYIETTGDTDLHCCHATANPASGRVMEKCGFVYDHDGILTRLDGTELEARYYVYRPGQLPER